MFKAKSMNELMKQKRHNRIDEAKSQANVQSKIIYKAISPLCPHSLHGTPITDLELHHRFNQGQ